MKVEAARAFDVARVVYTSAKGVYGPVLGDYGAPTHKPVPEDHPKNPKRIYDSAKLMAEQVGLYYQAHMGVDVVVLRFATTYGPGPRADVDVRSPASSVYDISRARPELGYAPQYDLERGITDYLESLKRLKAS